MWWTQTVKFIKEKSPLTTVVKGLGWEMRGLRFNLKKERKKILKCYVFTDIQENYKYMLHKFSRSNLLI